MEEKFQPNYEILNANINMRQKHTTRYCTEDWNVTQKPKTKEETNETIYLPVSNSLLCS